MLVPATGAPLAIIPEIGRAIIEKTWIKQIRSWPSPRPEDEGTSLVVVANPTCPGASASLATFAYPHDLVLPINHADT